MRRGGGGISLTDRCRIICADVLDGLSQLEDGSANCCVTSPPYYMLRDYKHDGQLGMENTPEEYVSNLVGVFREVRRVLCDDGTLWLNIGDSYAANRSYQVPDSKHTDVGNGSSSKVPHGCKPKDLIGIPWMLAFALRADGWYLRCDIIWAKPNAMPESVTDRPTKAHEYLFLLSKKSDYYYDSDAIRERLAPSTLLDKRGRIVDEELFDSHISGKGRRHVGQRRDKQRGHSKRHAEFNDRWDLMTKEEQSSMGRNKRSVWEIPTQPYPGCHFAAFPEALVKPCILAGCPEDGLVLDPFMGSGTTGQVALDFGRRFVGIELNPEYVKLAEERIAPSLHQGKLFA